MRLRQPLHLFRDALDADEAVTKGQLDAAGVADLRYRHIQDAAALEWTVTHNLGKYPSVTVIDSGGSQVHGDVEYVNLNTLVIRFSAAFGGEAHLN